MEFLLNRYRNLTVLLLVVTAQLLVIAYQVRTTKDVPLIRVWAVTAVTPVERALEFVRRNTWGFVEDYFILVQTRQKNDELNRALGQLKIENQYLRTELSTADRVRSLAVFQSHSPSKMIAARIVGAATGVSSKAVFVDSGSGSGVESGMAVVTPDGIVGKVVAAYPTASLVLLVTDLNFAAGVISQKNRVHGTLKGQGHDGAVAVDYVQIEERVDPGEWFYTSGDDRIFPKGFPVGPATTVRNGRNLKEIYVTPSGFQNGLEEVLIVLDAVHQPIPDIDTANANYKLIPAPGDSAGPGTGSQVPAGLATDADKLKEQYRELGDGQHHPFGEGPSSADFTKLPGLREQPSPAPGVKTNPGATPASPAAAAASQPGPGPVIPRPKPIIAETEADSAPPPKARPRPSAPPLVTDPTDADPNEPAISPPVRRSDPGELDRFGQPKSKPGASKPKPKTTEQRPNAR